jgi:hypothetical protein
MQANPNTPSLGSVVSEWEVLTVEDYQRTYSWQREEIDEFFGDLRETAANKEAHFFGTLILQSNTPGHASVVDGQQRLTTSYLTVAALRDAALNLPSDLISSPNELDVRVADEAWKFLVPGRALDVPRFHSNRFLSKLLTECVLAKPGDQKEVPARDTEITLRFRKAIRIIRDNVRKELEGLETNEAKLLRIYELLKTLLEKFLVLRVVSADTNESLEIFLTLNNRGLPLGPSDLVRGMVMSSRGAPLSEKDRSRLFSRIFDEWKLITENVDEPEVFLRHYLVATGESKVTKKKVVLEVEKRINNPDRQRNSEKATLFWNDLIETSELYSKIINPRDNSEMSYHLRILGGLLKSYRIFMIGLLKAQYSPAETNELVRILYVLCFRYVMAGENAQRLEDYFQGLCQDMSSGARSQEIKQSIASKIEALSLDTAKVLSDEADSGFIGKAILHGINRKLAKNANELILDKNTHLEHIAPNTSTDEWIRNLLDLPDDASVDSDEIRQEYESLKSEIGNLTLLDEKLNIEAQQRVLKEKKKIYHRSVYLIARELENARIATWNRSMVKNRTQWVAEMFDLIWAIEVNPNSIRGFNDWAPKE